MLHNEKYIRKYIGTKFVTIFNFRASYVIEL